MGKHQPQTEAEREQRRAQDRERLEHAAEQLLSSEGWRCWVRARASNGLARYSLSNQLLVALQSEGRATFVAGFKRTSTPSPSRRATATAATVARCSTRSPSRRLVGRDGGAIAVQAPRATESGRWTPAR